jgi:hypothetical protein
LIQDSSKSTRWQLSFTSNPESLADLIAEISAAPQTIHHGWVNIIAKDKNALKIGATFEF